jgi:uncharacterized phiE125 gp8 family phage protein
VRSEPIYRGDVGENTGLTIRVKTNNTVLPISVADFKTYAKVDTSADDALIELMIRSVKDSGENTTRLTWFTKTIVAEWESHARSVDLPIGPHLSIVKVEQYEDGVYTTLTTDDYTVTGEDFLTLHFDDWGYGLRVEFTAGYGASAANLPDDLKLGVYKATLSAYEDRQNLAEGSFTEIPGGTKKFFAGRRRILI